MEDVVDWSSKIGEAVLYALNQETYLKRHLEDRHLSIDNLAAERILKDFVLGRRSWLLAKKEYPRGMGKCNRVQHNGNSKLKK